jgi:hypothetical protein
MFTVASALDELLVTLRGPARRKVMRSAHMKSIVGDVPLQHQNRKLLLR